MTQRQQQEPDSERSERQGEKGREGESGERRVRGEETVHVPKRSSVAARADPLASPRFLSQQLTEMPFLLQEAVSSEPQQEIKDFTLEQLLSLLHR